MSLYNGPPRGGARGGKDQFNWENVKSDKDREFYLGHSVKASVGRWQKGKDLFWYTREKQDGAAAVQTELATIKAKEDELMMEALGLKPKTVRPKIQPKLDKMEMKQLLEKGDEEEGDEAGRTDADQIKGIGYRSGQILGAGEVEREVMAGVGTGRLSNLVEGAGPPSTSKMLPPPPQISGGDLKRLRKAQKKELKRVEKKAKKQAKKEARKEAKRAKKAAKRGRPDSSSSGSSDSDSSGSPSPPPPKRVRTTDEGRQDARHHNNDRHRGDPGARDTSAKVEREPTSRMSRDDDARRDKHESRRDGREERTPRREHQRQELLRRPRSRSPGQEHERRRHDNYVARRR